MAENTNTERADFEAWAISQKLGEYTAQMGFRYHDAGNLYPAWQAWQARASLSLPAAGQEPVAWEGHARKLTQWLHCMSYNDSYFGEPAGLVKQVTAELNRLIGVRPTTGATKKLWLWKNFVNGKPEYWAFDNPFPCASVGGDPLTFGEPCGWALFKPSVNGRPDRSEQEVTNTVMRLAAAPQPAAQVAGQEPVAADALATLRGAFAPFAQEPKWTTEHSMKYPSKAAQIINAVRDLLASAPQTGAQEQSEWDIRGQLAAKLTCWHRLTGNEAAELVALAKSWGAPQPAVAAGWPLIARALNEWHEDDGPVMWWAWNGSASGWAGEPAWCGTPLSSDWPGYHTHWTPHPTFPPAPSTEGESRGQ